MSWVALNGVPKTIFAGVAQVIAGGCWKMTISDAVTLLEKFGLEAVALIRPVVELPAP